jgi:hypothetical protein
VRRGYEKLPRWSARHYVPSVDPFFSCLSCCRYYRLVLDTTHHSSRDTRRVRPTRSNHGPSRPHWPASFSFPLSYISGLALWNNVYRHQSATTRHLYELSFILIYPSLYVLILSLFNHHHRHPWGRPYNTDLRGSNHVYKTAPPLIEESIDPNQPDSLPLPFSRSSVCLPSSRRLLCGTVVHAISAHPSRV